MSNHAVHDRSRKPTDSPSGSPIWVYAVETGVALGLGFGAILLLLWLLQGVLPEGTGLGELVRGRTSGASSETRIAIDGSHEAMIAVLTRAENSVMERPANSVAWSSARRGSALGDRHAIQTQEGSTATIAFDENTAIDLSEKSVIVVRKPRRILGADKRRASIVFKDGFLRGRIGAGQDDVELEVLAAGATIHASGTASSGAALEVQVVDDTSAVAVHQGTVAIDWGEETTVVPEGFMVSYDGRSAPSRPVPLPLAPRPLAPAPSQRFSYRSVPPRVQFDWHSESGGEFQVQIARDPEFADLVYDARTTDSTMIHENLEAGSYVWRVFARNGPLAGPPSPARRFVIVRDGEPPALQVDFPEETVTFSPITLTGRTEPGGRLFVGDDPVDVAPDGSFASILPVRDGYNFVVVQAVDPNGNTTFANHTILARLDGKEAGP